MSQIEQKSISATIDEKGSVEAEFSVFDVEDRDGDIVTASALQPFAGKSLPMVWSHDWSQPVGKGSISVSERAAVFSGTFLDTTRGQEAYETVKQMGDLQQWSWGFRVTDAVREKRGNKSVRVIKGVEPFEVSPVLVGANPYTSTIAVKSGLDSLTDDDREEIAKSLIAIRDKDIHKALAEITETHKSICTLGGECPAMNELDRLLAKVETETPGDKAQRRELERALARVKLEG